MVVEVWVGGTGTRETGNGWLDWTGHRTPGGRSVRAGKAAGSGSVREKYGRRLDPWAEMEVEGCRTYF